LRGLCEPILWFAVFTVTLSFLKPLKVLFADGPQPLGFLLSFVTQTVHPREKCPPSVDLSVGRGFVSLGSASSFDVVMFCLYKRSSNAFFTIGF